MPDSKNNPSLRHSGAPASDDDAPIREPRASSPEPDAFLLGFGASSNDAAVPLPRESGTFADDHAPKDDDDAGKTATRALTNAFLAKKATQDRIREVVEARHPFDSLGKPAKSSMTLKSHDRPASRSEFQSAS